MEQQRNYIFLWHGFDEGDMDIQLGVHTAKEYNTCMKSRTWQSFHM